MLYTYFKAYGNNIFVRYKTEDDVHTRSKVIDNYQPTLYTQTDQPSDTTSIFGYNLKPIQLESIKDAKTFTDRCSSIDNFYVEGNGNYANQFMIELYDGKSPDYSDDMIRVGILDIEVHTTGPFPVPEKAEWPINAITIFDTIERCFYTFALKHREEDHWTIEAADDAVQNLKVEYFEFESEKDLMRSFLSHINDHAYDVTSGWHSETFDMPYIVNRSYHLFKKKYTNKMLSPFGIINIREVFGAFGKPKQKVDIVGLPHLDYMELYKKHTHTPRESYKLDFIAHAELGEKKLSYEEMGDLQGLYEKDYQRFIDYNIQDVNLIVRLEDQLGLFSLVYAMTYYTLSNFEDTMGTVKIWEQLISKFLYHDNRVPLFQKQDQEERDFEGAFVKEPIRGFHDWVVTSDLKSLYPHIEQQWNIGPETHVPYDSLPGDLRSIVDTYTFDDILEKKADMSALDRYEITMAPNFEFYRTDKMSFFSEIKRSLYAQRSQHKQKMLEAQRNKVASKDPDTIKYYERIEAREDNMQMGLKILLNGGYGALANKHFLYYKVENAEAITTSGRLVNQWTSSHVNDRLKEMFDTTQECWIYSDTDSGLFTINKFVETLPKSYTLDQLTDACIQFYDEVMDPIINERCEELKQYLNCYEQRMFWNREIVSNKAIWVSRKKYVMSILDSEGTRFTQGDPEYKIMGMEAVKSSYPEWSRELLKEMYITAITHDEETLQEKYATIYEKFLDYEVSDISIPSGINGVDKYYDATNLYKKGTPKHVKAALVHNSMLERLGLDHIQPIGDGDKIKYIELKMPNPTGYPMVAFDTYVPKEFDVEAYIDYDAIFEASFKKPLNIFLSAINWEPEYVHTLM